MAREKIPVIRHIETGEVFAFEDRDYDNAVGVFMKERGWTHHDITWLADDYYAVTWDEDLTHWHLDHIVGRGDPLWPRPIGIEGFGYLHPQPVHLCSVTASQYGEVVEYRACWSAEVLERADFEEFNEHWYSELLEVERGLDTHDYKDVIDECGRPRKTAFTAVAGPYYFEHSEYPTEQERDDEMRELCQSNPPL